MEDNDIRGFTDGRFIAAWNQPTQVHVRLGRKRRSWAKHGDCELFRVLHRWTDIWLPSGAKVSSARLELDVEHGRNRELEVLLYEVHKDWEPGEGGLLRNNNSAPSEGEVWWNEVAHGVRSWGLPGAGFASDSHPDADTPVEPLAIAQYKPRDATIVFESAKLASYVETRTAQAEPLLFLLKLADYLEDIPGTSIDVYSGNHGDDRNTARRPRLDVQWHSPTDLVSISRRVLLEHGRSLLLPPIERDDIQGLAVSFDAETGAERPTVHVRGGTGSASSGWQSVEYPQRLDWEGLEIRLDACRNPIPLGDPFTAAIRDTWVTAGPPDEQDVVWSFRSPSGTAHTGRAVYEGDWRWRIEFVPEELGRWHYQWHHHFTGKRYESAVGRFDVIPGEKANALHALDRLIARMRDSDLPAGRQRASAFAVTFNRLQRSLMRYETPETFPLSPSSEDGGEVGPRLDEAREAFGGSRPQAPRLAFEPPKGITIE